MASKQSFKGEGKTFQGPLKIPYALERMSGNTRYIVSPFHFPPSIPNSAHPFPPSLATLALLLWHPLHVWNNHIKQRFIKQYKNSVSEHSDKISLVLQ